MRGRILVVDDEPLKRITLQIELSEQGFEVYEAADAETARRIFDSKPIDVVVTDVRMPGMNGLDLLAYLKQVRPDVDVILMTAYATVDTAVLAIKRGAYDYITKPFTTQELLRKLEHLFASRAQDAGDEQVEQFGALAARSRSMRRLFERARSIAAGEQAVLLCGESGVGKCAIAQAIHEHGPRASRRLVRVSCAAAGDDLDADLFGAEGGPAKAPRVGKIEQADGGTLLLTEVDELPEQTQARLLAVIEQHEFERVGGAAPMRADVRLVCTTRRDLATLVKDGRFREDLHYRLNVIELIVPPLRERPDDIPLLAKRFLCRHAASLGLSDVRIAQHAMDELLRHDWPGNVRELEHVIERALAFCGGDEIRAEHVVSLTHRDQRQRSKKLELTPAGRGNLNETVADIERRMILMALKQCNGNQARAAQKLGIPRTTLRDKMAKYSIPVG
ncbi:MAG: sigma-54-dependent Fis family transcriptional regulator [Planctomycetota bacterium]|nr:MAG: sigma-54-dependent Fis family transcriptional regulator [Planctomycetota bacterium]